MSATGRLETRESSERNEWDEGLVPGFKRFDALDLCKGEVVHQHIVLGGFR